LKASLLVVLLLICVCKPHAQQTLPYSDVRFYGGVLHQHHDYFQKAFSFQGIEGGAVFDHHFLVGIYGLTFISSLEVDIANMPTYLQMWQGGLVAGIVTDSREFLHAGLLLNAGYFSVIGDHHDFPLFNSDTRPIGLGGLILCPQVSAEVNITKWMKMRAGLAYDFYGLQDDPLIRKTDLQNISFNFGLLFGEF
jgi:hypothetical protein